MKMKAQNTKIYLIQWKQSLDGNLKLLMSTLKKEERSQISLILHFKKAGKEKQTNTKQTVERNELGNRKTVKKMNKTKNLFFV